MTWAAKFSTAASHELTGSWNGDTGDWSMSGATQTFLMQWISALSGILSGKTIHSGQCRIFGMRTEPGATPGCERKTYSTMITAMFTGDALKHCPCGYGTGLQALSAAASVQHRPFHRQPLARRRRQHQVRQWWCSLGELVVSAASGVCLGNQAQLCSAHLTGGLQGNQQPIVEGA